MPDSQLMILCFSDLHRDREAAESLARRSEAVDLVIGAGDFANRHEGLEDTLDALRFVSTPTVLVPGNGETETELTDAAADWKSATVLHAAGVQFDSLPPIWGVGGGIPVTPFGDWSYDFDETTATEMLADCPHHGILVTHSPPLDSVDHDASGRIRGSQAIRDCVERCRPILTVCGHIHSDWTKHVRIGDSLVVNAGPVGVLVQISDGRAEVVDSPSGMTFS